jgi:hypothetical protein
VPSGTTLSVCDTVYVDFVNVLSQAEEFCKTDTSNDLNSAILAILSDPYTLSISDGFHSYGWISGVGGPGNCYRPEYIAITEVVACI